MPRLWDNDKNARGRVTGGVGSLICWRYLNCSMLYRGAVHQWSRGVSPPPPCPPPGPAQQLSPLSPQETIQRADRLQVQKVCVLPGTVGTYSPDHPTVALSVVGKPGGGMAIPSPAPGTSPCQPYLK